MPNEPNFGLMLGGKIIAFFDTEDDAQNTIDRYIVEYGQHPVILPIKVQEEIDSLDLVCA